MQNSDAIDGIAKKVLHSNVFILNRTVFILETIA